MESTHPQASARTYTLLRSQFGLREVTPAPAPTETQGNMSTLNSNQRKQI